MRSLEAFRTLIEHKVSGAGIVDEDGKLIGNLSASDLKDIGNSCSFTPESNRVQSHALW
jgi:CBS domain-containing protein